jgi:hypothetical protein
MSSTIGSVVGAPIRVGDREFARLTLDDWASLEGDLQKQINAQRDGWLVLLSKHGVTASEMPALIRDLHKPPTTTEVWRFILSPSGARATLRLSAKRAGWEFTPDIEATIGYPPVLSSLACEVAGMNRQADDDDTTAGSGGVPLADTSTAETGPPKPPSSDASTGSNPDA